MTVDQCVAPRKHKKHVCLCGLSVDTEFIPAEWIPFQKSSSNAATSVRIEENLHCNRAIGRTLAKAPGFCVKETSDSNVGFALAESKLPCVTATSDYRLITVCSSNSEEVANLIRVPLECRFCHESIISLHAACVEGNGYAVCFTGDSGVGKSTRAHAWVQGLGAQFISGDRPAIRLEQQGCTACGVPWDGKEQIFRNVERPLSAILEVRRAPFTRLRRLTEEQAYQVLIRQSFIPMWDADTAALAMVNVGRLSRSVPVYRLFCGPDEKNARETYRLLFEAPEEIREELPDMQIKEGFILRTIGSEHMVMPTGENIAKFGGAVVLSETAAFIFEQLKQPIAREDLVQLIVAEFDVDEDTAGKDLDELVKQFEEMGVMEG